MEFRDCTDIREASFRIQMSEMDFISTMGRESADIQEFEKWARFMSAEIRNQIEWDAIFDLVKAQLRDG